jgi:putative FmdB family regulatory protein
MPIYEFYCSPCHRIYSFLSRAIDTERAPDCPRCGAKQLARRASSFAISKGRPERAQGEDEAVPDVDEAKLMRLMEELGPEAENINEDDPRQAAHMMRRLFDAAGLPVGSGMEEALRRMAAGEDPEKVEQDLGDSLDQDPFSAGERKRSFASLRRRLLPPSVDTHLYEL